MLTYWRALGRKTLLFAGFVFGRELQTAEPQYEGSKP